MSLEEKLKEIPPSPGVYLHKDGAGKAIGSLFATHPPMEKRIAALQRLEMQLQGTA